MADNEVGIRVTSKDDTGPGFSSVKKSSDDAASSLDKVGEAADGAEGKAQGFSDTLTGTADVMSGASQIAKGDLFGGLVTLGGGMADLAGGMADLAGGMASFLIPALKGMSLSSVKARAATIAQTAATKAATIAQKAMNIAMRMNPIGLVIAAIVALIAIVVVIEKKTGFFSKVWTKAWGAIQRGAAAAFGWIKEHWPLLLAILTGPIGIAVLVIVKKKDAILNAFKKIPGAIRSAFGTLSDVITAPFRAAFDAVKALWNSTVGGFGFSIPSWVPKVGGNEFRIPEMARGGISGALASRMAMVGERGRELVRLPVGSQVIPNGQTERMLGGGGGGGGGSLVLELRSSGSRVDDVLLELLRNAIRVRGGDVQVVLGRSG